MRVSCRSSSVSLWCSLRSWAGEVPNVSLLVAIGVNSEGYREILGIRGRTAWASLAPPACRPNGRAQMLGFPSH
jgi:hypothetical protein